MFMFYVLQKKQQSNGLNSSWESFANFRTCFQVQSQEATADWEEL